MAESYSAKKESELFNQLYDAFLDILVGGLRSASKGFIRGAVHHVVEETTKYLDIKGKKALSFWVKKSEEILERERVPIDEILNEVGQEIKKYQMKLGEIERKISISQDEWRNKVTHYLKQLDEIDREREELLQRAYELRDIARNTGIRSAEDRMWLEKEYTPLENKRDEIDNKEADICQKLYSLLEKEILPLVVEKCLVEKNLDDFKEIHNYLSNLRKDTPEVTLREWWSLKSYLEGRELGEYAASLGSSLGGEAKESLRRLISNLLSYSSSTTQNQGEDYRRRNRNYLLLIIAGLTSSLATLHFVDFSMKGMFLIQPHVSIAYLVISSILLATLFYLIFKKK